MVTKGCPIWQHKHTHKVRERESACILYPLCMHVQCDALSVGGDAQCVRLNSISLQLVRDYHSTCGASRYTGFFYTLSVCVSGCCGCGLLIEGTGEANECLVLDAPVLVAQSSLQHSARVTSPPTNQRRENGHYVTADQSEERK